MTSQEPVRFENYPPRDTTPSRSFDDPPAATAEFEITPYRPTDVPPAPPASTGLGRRNLLTLLLAVPAGAVALAVISETAATMPPADPYDPPMEDPGYADGGRSGDTIEAGQYSAVVPDGWTVDARSSDPAIVTKGANRVLAHAFAVDPGRHRAIDLIGAVARPRLGTFTGVLPAAEDLSDPGSGVQHAVLTASGQVGRKAATMRAQLWTDDIGNALLVMATLVAKPGTATAREAAGIVDELSGPFS